MGPTSGPTFSPDTQSLRTTGSRARGSGGRGGSGAKKEGRAAATAAEQETAKFWSRLWLRLRLRTPRSAAFSVPWPPPAPPPKLPVPVRGWKAGTVEERSAAAAVAVAAAAAAAAAVGRCARAELEAPGDCRACEAGAAEGLRERGRGRLESEEAERMKACQREASASGLLGLLGYRVPAGEWT
ncbi:hypothetical protein HJG60_010629 [Phyllostomus discolor]|uniref:Uncharacterized protein n=1 Tax=Phyllostomus discolor TaxID=89673 RepID=A0A834ARP8_9CHIR|nr:hypothetical protein HJG60_010629 [Phyllostomus discolor]